ncbi:hypothetical protein BDN72DRAFT_774895, partial [Pluteus cervinus]
MLLLGSDLTEAELATLWLFAYKTEFHLTDDAFEGLKNVFPETPMDSWKETRSAAASLSLLKPVFYDCCANLCCCFVGVYADADECPYCHQARYRSAGADSNLNPSGSRKPRKRFAYIPLIPRLLALFRSKPMVESLSYRATFHSTADSDIEDIFSGTHYHQLQEEFVTIGDERLDHKFFSGSRDLALGLSTDGFAPFRWRKKT